MMTVKPETRFLADLVDRLGDDAPILKELDADDWDAIGPEIRLLLAKHQAEAGE